MSQDKLPDVYFTFWLVDEFWTLVGTNLTREREKWSREEQKRLRDRTYEGKVMLTFLQNVFRQKFPDKALHESVGSREVTTEDF